MKRKNYFLMLLASIGVMACAPEKIEPENTTPEVVEKEGITLRAEFEKDEIEFMPEYELKREPLCFNEGDVIQVKTNGQDPALYHLEGNDWIAENGSEIKWVKNIMSIEATYPVAATAEGYTIPTDQSTPEALAEANYLHHSGLHKKGKTIEMKFTHKTSRISLRVFFAPDILEPKIKSVIVTGNTNPFTGDQIIEDITANFKDGVYTALVASTARLDLGIKVIYEHTESGSIKEETLTFDGFPEIKENTSFCGLLTISTQANGMRIQKMPYWEMNYKFEDPSDLAKAYPENNSIVTEEAGYITPEKIREALNNGTVLHIEGPINGTDLRAIREAAGCKYDAESATNEAIIKELDLSEATIVAGGLPYASSFENGELTTKDNELGMTAFSGCGLQKIQLPANLTVLADACFQSSTALETVEIGDQLTTIGGSCFSDCTSLKKLVIPGSVTKIHGYFISGTNLEELYILGNYTENRSAVMNGDEFSGFENSKNCALVVNQSWSQFVTFGENGEKSFGGVVWKSIPIDKPVTPTPPDPVDKPHALKFLYSGILAGTTDLNVQSVTLEAEVMFTGFNNCNTILGKENVLLLRVGDVLASPTIPENQIQISGVGIPSFHYANQHAILKNVWYHLAFTYNHTTGVATIYIDGKPVVSREWNSDLSFNLGGNGEGNNGNGLMVGKIIGYQHGERPLDGFMREVRVWSVERDALELIGGRSGVPVNSRGLELYYKMDGKDIESGVIKDATGKRNGKIAGELTWTPYGN